MSSPDLVWQTGGLERPKRAELTGGEGLTVWLTGLSGSGKSTIAIAIERALYDTGRLAYVLDGDNVRHGLNADLTFTAVDRSENVRRVGEVALLMADAGLVVLVPVISPYRADREKVRERHHHAGVRLVEVFVDTPLAVCEQRDPKGLYARARRGEILGMTGIDDPYEPPIDADLTLDTSELDVAAAVDRVLARIRTV